MSFASDVIKAFWAMPQKAMRLVSGVRHSMHPHTPPLALVVLVFAGAAHGTPLEFFVETTTPDGAKHEIVWKTIDLEQTVWTPYETTLGGQKQWLGKLGTADVAWLSHTLRVHDIPTGFYVGLYSYGRTDGWLVQAGEDGNPVDPNGDMLAAYQWLYADGSPYASGSPSKIRLSTTTGDTYDLNDDGTVDAGDASLLFGQWTGDSVPSVPEPSGLAIMLAMCLLGPTKRR